MGSRHQNTAFPTALLGVSSLGSKDAILLNFEPLMTTTTFVGYVGRVDIDD